MTVRETFCLDYCLEYFFVSFVSFLWKEILQTLGANSWELFLVFIFPFIFKNRDKWDKRQWKVFWIFTRSARIELERKLGAISWETFLVFIFPFIFEDRDKWDKRQGCAREMAGLNSICLFCLLFIKKDSPNAGGNPRRAFSHFYFSFYFEG